MNKIEIEVPINVRYISEWTNFPKEQLSTGHCIVNKTITGCGYTHYTLTNDQNVILCSPRKFLLENKHRQLKDIYNTYLVINNNEKGIDIDSSGEKTKTKEVKVFPNESFIVDNFEEIERLKDDLRSYIFLCQFNRKPIKILVTYDSLKYVLDQINNLELFSIIVDEFQNIFIDSSFKAETELNFVSYLQSCPNVTYLSATPYIEEYLEELDEFKNLPYYEFKWHPDRLETIKIEPRKVTSISSEVDNIIKDYLLAKFPEKVDESGINHQSKEVVFYMNSVKMISSTILRNNLIPDQVNIICADTEKNKKTLKKIGFEVGTSPLCGQPHKMFTFCTRTTYAGADFYSTSALSVIVSDCKVDSLVTDIRMDFPQIMGRQRLKENVFRDECIFIFSLSDNAITLEEFESRKAQKFENSKKDLINYDLVKNNGYYDIILSDLRDRVKKYHYLKDYTGIDERTGKPVLNKLVYISEKRAFELRSNVYKNEVQVYNEFAEISSDMSFEDALKKAEHLNNLRNMIKSSKHFYNNIKLVCDTLLDPIWFGKIHISDFYWLPRTYRNYLNYLGPERIKALGYIEADLKKEFSFKKSGNRLSEAIYSTFQVGKRYSLREIKDILREVYNFLNLQKTPKASDLEEYYDLKSVKIYDPITKKQSGGYEILKIKE